MEHFFSAIATVMSNQLRGAVQKALNDFIYMLEVYGSGNTYSGTYKRGLPTVNNAIVIGLVSEHSSIYYSYFSFILAKVSDQSWQMLPVNRLHELLRSFKSE